MEIHQLPISQHHHHLYLHSNHLNHFDNNSFVDSFNKSHQQQNHHNNLQPNLNLNNCPQEIELINDIDINSNTSNLASLTNLNCFDQIKNEKNTILHNKSNSETNTNANFINSNNLNIKYEEDVCIGSAFNTATKPSSSMDNFCEVLQQHQTMLPNQRTTNYYDTNNIQNRKTIFVEMQPSSLMIHPSNDLQNNNQYNNHNSQHHYQEPSSSATSSLSASSSVSDVINIKSLTSVANASIDRKRPYPCTLCPSRFGSKMELEEHQNSHTGMKPFQCDICQSRFNRRSTLWNHKRIHSDAKPFFCSVCQMTFKWKNSLKCHKEMHFRKNETNSIQDNDIRLLTYATAAKRQLSELNNDNNKANNNKSNNETLLSNGFDSMNKRNYENKQQQNLKPKSNITSSNNAIKLNQSTNFGAVKNCNSLIITDSLKDSLIKQEFTKIKPIALVNNNINSNNFSTDTHLMNRCSVELNYQNNIFSQLKNNTKNNFSEQDCCNNGTINMQLPFLNFGFQQLNNSLVAEQQQQQANHLPNNNTSAFESFQSHQHQQQQYQHQQQQQKQHNLTGLSYECGNGNFNLPTNPDSLLNNYTMLDSAILSVAAEPAATATPSMIVPTSQEEDIGTYFNYQNTTLENGAAYNNLINDNIVQQQQQQLNRNNSNNNQLNSLLMVSSASELPTTTQSMMMMSTPNLRSTDTTPSMQSSYIY